MIPYVVNSKRDIPSPPARWDNPAQFNKKNALVDHKGVSIGANYNGPKYVLIAKHVRKFSIFERVFRAAFGIVIAPAALCSKSTKGWMFDLFKKKFKHLYLMKIGPGHRKRGTAYGTKLETVTMPGENLSFAEKVKAAANESGNPSLSLKMQLDIKI